MTEIQLINETKTDLEIGETNERLIYLHDLKMQSSDSEISDSSSETSSDSDFNCSNYSSNISMNSQDSDYIINQEFVKQHYANKMIDYLNQ